MTKLFSPQLSQLPLKRFPESQQRVLTSHWSSVMVREVGNVVADLGTLIPGIKIELNRI